MSLRVFGGRPKAGYLRQDGSKVPSVTTITGRYKSGGDALLYWAAKCEREGKRWKDVRDSAGTVGTAVHDAIELYIKEEQITVPDFWRFIGNNFRLSKAEQDQAWLAFTAWEGFWQQEGKHVEWHQLERPLVSEQYGFGGTFDAFGTYEKQPVLYDWKTSSGIYPSYAEQLGAYSILLKENDGTEVSSARVCRFDKKTGRAEIKTLTRVSLDLCEKQFLRLVDAYHNDLPKKIWT